MLATRARDNVCLRRVLQRRRRPGRARLRRALGRARRRGRGARARARVRGGAARRRHRARRRRSGRRLRDVRRRSLESEREAAAEVAGRPTSAAPRAGRRPDRSRRSPRMLDDLEQMRLGARARPARLRREERVPATSSIGVSGGIDSALDRGDRRRGARPRPRPLRLDAVALQLGGDARDARAARRVARHRLPRAPDRAGRRELPGDASPTSSPAASPTRPRRTSRRGPAACC